MTLMTSARMQARFLATSRPKHMANMPKAEDGRNKRVGRYFGENVFDIKKASNLPDSVKKEILSLPGTGRFLTEEQAKVVAAAVLEWAIEKGVTHFCHWFQPLTGSTAEKHDAFVTFNESGEVIEKFSASQLMQGEPDASSFPHGGSRSTFEARGYTSWDTTSPIFIMEGTNGKTLFIPTAFVSYHGDALDIKTPLLRSLTKVNKTATEFLNLIGERDVKSVQVNCGYEQEYFLIDKAFYYQRPDLVMTRRTLLGSLTTKNQQLEDHYFGTVPERVLAFMQELEIELYRLGIPAKTRHNEVAPGQFEIAPIFRDANTASDHNHICMAMLEKIALKHDFVVLMHEKPFAGVNGSGKHLNWSISDDRGNNQFAPGKTPQTDLKFLTWISIVMEAVYRHSSSIRMSVSGHGNDHRLGANEAPPSIISVYLGDTITSILEGVVKGVAFTPKGKNFIDVGDGQLAQLLRDNTDRNRTSPFAFTGNRFEFRAVGASQNIGYPLAILNAALADVLVESNEFIKKELAAGRKTEDAMVALIKRWAAHAWKIIFNGDNYSTEWVKEAASRGLPNFSTTPEALMVLKDEVASKFLVDTGVFNRGEIKTRYNVMVERYLKCRDIEFCTLIDMVHQHVIPSTVKYALELARAAKAVKEAGLDSSSETELLGTLNSNLKYLTGAVNGLQAAMKKHHTMTEEEWAVTIPKELMPFAENIRTHANTLENLIADELWTLPKYYDMLFVR
jgi:glutamine synthetase